MGKQRFAQAVANVLTSWLKDAEVSIINSQLLYFVCVHSNDADLQVLVDLGVPIPKLYGEEKHWHEGMSAFDFFMTKEIYDKMVIRIKKEKDEKVGVS